jgi:uncharacterized protein YceK
MKLRRFIIMIVCVLTLSIAGCGSIYYYKITDPSTGNAYYSQKVEKQKQGGSVSFTDAKSGNMVTLQNSEIAEISKDEYKAILPKK